MAPFPEPALGMTALVALTWLACRHRTSNGETSKRGRGLEKGTRASLGKKLGSRGPSARLSVFISAKKINAKIKTARRRLGGVARTTFRPERIGMRRAEWAALRGGHDFGAARIAQIPHNFPSAAVVSAGDFGLSAGCHVRCRIPGARESQRTWECGSCQLPVGSCQLPDRGHRPRLQIRARRLVDSGQSRRSKRHGPPVRAGDPRSVEPQFSTDSAESTGRRPVSRTTVSTELQSKSGVLGEE